MVCIVHLCGECTGGLLNRHRKSLKLNGFIQISKCLKLGDYRKRLKQDLKLDSLATVCR